MPASLGAALGERFVAGGRVYYAAPTPERLAAAPLDAIRGGKLGHGDRYQGYAGFYLATDTDAWANDIGARPLGASREPRFGAGDHAIARAS
jgi:hypothetical protein